MNTSPLVAISRPISARSCTSCCDRRCVLVQRSGQRRLGESIFDAFPRLAETNGCPGSRHEESLTPLSRISHSGNEASEFSPAISTRIVGDRLMKTSSRAGWRAVAK
jgi:hypothetical protein